MIILDEQLLGRDLENEIGRWYQGAARFITDLRPHTVIKDDAIPKLLQQENRPTFVTINERDFWRKIQADPRYCVVCLFCLIRFTCSRDFRDFARVAATFIIQHEN